MFMFVVMTAFSFSSVETACPSGYNERFQCSCYKVELWNHETRSGAQQICEADSGHLVFIDSEEEKEALAVWYTWEVEGSLWIGLNGATVNEMTWDDGSNVEFTSFDQVYHPIYVGSGCYRLVPSGYNVDADTWHDKHCGNRGAYICEFEDPDQSLCRVDVAVNPGCPSGFETYNDLSCYDIRPTSWSTRQEAQDKCETQSSHLVFINSLEEKTFLADTYNPDFQYWLGVNGLEYDDKTWDDGSAVEIDLFGNDVYAYNDYSGCYRIVPHDVDRWYDWSCNGQFGFICEYELEEVVTTKQPTTTEPVPTTTTERVTTAQPTTTTAATTQTERVTTVQPTTTTARTTTQSETTHIQTTTSRPATTNRPTTAEASTTKTTEQETTHIQTTTSRPTTTNRPTTAEVSTTETTEQETTNKPTTTEETRTDTAEQLIDFGESLGLPTIGVYIPDTSIVTSYAATPITRCNIRCSRHDCFAVIIQNNGMCHIAFRRDDPQTNQTKVRSRFMNCFVVADLSVCR